MKKKFTILFIYFNITLSNAQSDCDTYIDFMSSAVEQNNIDKAKADMKAFIACKEEELGINNPKIKLINHILYLKYYTKDILLANTDETLNYSFLLIDKNLNIITLKSYTAIGKIKEGLIQVFEKKNNTMKCGFIDINGREITPLKYDDTTPFKNDYAVVQLDSKFGIIDKKGKVVIPLIYTQILRNFDDNYIVKLHNKYRLFDKSLNQITTLEYDFIYNSIINNTVRAYQVGIIGKTFYINSVGKCVKDCENAPLNYPKSN